MSKLFVVAIVLVISCLFFVTAAPAGDLWDAQTIIHNIIAEYEKIPGHSVHYPPEIGTYLDPHHLQISI